jgi:hypothetical protein
LLDCERLVTAAETEIRKWSKLDSMDRRVNCRCARVDGCGFRATYLEIDAEVLERVGARWQAIAPHDNRVMRCCKFSTSSNPMLRVCARLAESTTATKWSAWVGVAAVDGDAKPVRAMLRIAPE